MKKGISLILALVLCLVLCACGKSEAVKNVEAMIEALGEITVESIDDIRAAEDAYAALTPEEQEKVKNYETLISARDRYLELILVGNWIDPYIYTSDAWENYDKRVNLTLNSDMTGTERGDGNMEFPCTWSVTGGFLKIVADEDYWTEYEVQEKDGKVVLQSPGSNWSLMRLEDYHALLGDIFLIVDFSEADPMDFFGFEIIDLVIHDEWGEPTDDHFVGVQLTSRLYEHGWIYLSSSEEFALEVIHPEYHTSHFYRNALSWDDTVAAGSQTLDWHPFDFWNGGIRIGSYDAESSVTYDLDVDELSFGRSRGLVVFINSAHAQAKQSKDGYSRVVVTDFTGDSEIYTGQWWEGLNY